MNVSMLVVVTLLAQAPTAAPSALDEKMRSLFAPGGLTADEVSKRAVELSRELEGRRAAVDAAEAQVVGAASGFIPRVTGLASYTYQSPIVAPTLGLGNDGRFVVVAGDPGPVGTRTLIAAPDFTFPVFLDNYVLRAGVTVPVSDYVWRSVQQLLSAKHAKVGAGLDERVARLKAANDGRLAYYAWVRARGQQLVAQQTLEQSRSRAADIRRAFDVGSASRADVLRGESQVEQSRLLLARTDNLAGLTEQQLRVAMRLASGPALGISSKDFDALGATPAVNDEEALVRQAAGSRLELKSLAAVKDSLEAQRRAAWAGVVPRLDGTASLLYANPNPRFIPNDGKWHFTWDVGVALSWAPTDIPSAVAQVNAADARARQTQAQLSAVEEALRVEVTQAVLALRETEVALESTKKAQDAAEEGYRVRQELFSNGRSTAVEVIDAQTELTRARLEALNAQIDARVARVRFEHAVGDDVARDAPARE